MLVFHSRPEIKIPSPLPFPSPFSYLAVIPVPRFPSSIVIVFRGAAATSLLPPRDSGRLRFAVADMCDDHIFDSVTVTITVAVTMRL